MASLFMANNRIKLMNRFIQFLNNGFQTGPMDNKSVKH